MQNIVRRTDSNQDIFDAVVNSLFRPFGGLTAAPIIDEGNLALDIAETDSEVVVRASLPGFQKKDVDVEVHDGVLSITASRSEEHEEKNERFYRKERRMGSVSRRVALPGSIEGHKAQAQLKDGVLEVRVPKTAEATPRKVNIG
ncbi:MAG: Hsp20/alpha crystallin family protein [Phycisphaeraceae bacterium]|nr:Hsp20/alpha crystallin family protein [Phycisphaeraceae bacterium]